MNFMTVLSDAYDDAESLRFETRVENCLMDNYPSI